MNDKEKRIKEKRLIEAAEKNMIGANGKLGFICKYLGQPIKGEGGSLHDYYEYSFDNWVEKETDFPVYDGNESVYTLGYMFYGITSGLDLEIKYISHENKLTCKYKGYEVYREVSGDLEGYAPFPEWENMVDNLYKKAQNKARIVRKNNAQEEAFDKRNQAKNFWQKIRERWGL